MTEGLAITSLYIVDHADIVFNEDDGYCFLSPLGAWMVAALDSCIFGRIWKK